MGRINRCKKIFDALTWLKCNNPLYKHIILPDTHDKLCSEENMEFFWIKDEIDSESVSNDDDTLVNSKIETQETKK